MYPRYRLRRTNRVSSPQTHRRQSPPRKRSPPARLDVLPYEIRTGAKPNILRIKLSGRTIPRKREVLYRAFKTKKIHDFARTYPFINMPTKIVRNTLTLIGHPQIPPYERVQWNDIRCKRYNAYMKAEPCRFGFRDKVFFKHAKDLRDYLLKLHSGKITRSQHDTLWSYVFRRRTFINHNMDVGTLHFKPGE